jgi:response regulator RpfG family c-di-GMP phosphodiesterase
MNAAPLSRILFVDDDPNLLAALQRTLRKRFIFDTALSGADALQAVDRSGPYAVIMADMSMPGMNGAELLEKMRELFPDTVRIMLTGNADQKTAADAVNRGEIFRFLTKPCPPETLVPALETAIKQYELLHTERELLEGTLTGSVKILAEVLGMVAPDALGRGQHLRESMQRLAHWVGAKPVWELEVAALLSPIGYAALPPVLLRKLTTGSDLTPQEAAIVRRVPRTGHDLVASIPRLSGVAQIVLYQNKHFDGGGFPADDLLGEGIPIGARLLKILIDRISLEADGIVKERAHQTMKARSGVYDPRLLELSFACFQSFLVSALSADAPVRALSVGLLQTGQVVVSDIQTPSGLILVTAGNRLTDMTIQRLRNHCELNDVSEPVLVQDAATVAVPAVAR